MSSSSDSDDFVNTMGIIFNEFSDTKKPEQKVRKYLLDRKHTEVVFKKLKNDPNLMWNYTRMTVSDFEDLLQMVTPMIQKETVTWEPLSTAFRLILTLRYLGTGESQRSLSFSYKCSPSSVHNIIAETTKAIKEVLKNKVFPVFTKEYLKNVAEGFQETWNFAHCIGAIDGKHINIQAPRKSGTEFYNYKHTYSIVLMAICDHDYKFNTCDIGAAGRQSDGGIFRNSSIGQKFYSNTLPIPSKSDVSPNFKNVPYVFVADDAFSLHENMLKPYKTAPTIEQKICNYRLSRARRMIENCFGILSSKWRILRTTIIADVSLVENIVEACVCLHNWLRSKNSNYILLYTLGESSSENLTSLQPSTTKNSTTEAKSTRDAFAKYFSTKEGAVSWQNNEI